MQSMNVRQIKRAILNQTMSGRYRVWIGENDRVIDVKTERGQLKAKTLNSGKWQPVFAVNID